MRERDPLSVLQDGSLEGGKDGGQLTPFKMAPNFELALYLAQATGACIATDSVYRWRELTAAAHRGIPGPLPLRQLQAVMEEAEFIIPRDGLEICGISDAGSFKGYPSLMRKVLTYLPGLPTRGAKPNVEASLSAEFTRAHQSAKSAAEKSGARTSLARASVLWPAGGIQDNTVNRLLLMSSSEHHLASAPMAMFIKRSLNHG
ncbi:MAG: hypothetical protein J0H84_19275 [Rhizobiales bacterium]|nr:hypothetical protein [Hyphomicrobiales bacterium]